MCSGNVLKEVKPERAVSKPVTECSEDLYEKQQQCRTHNVEETETNLIHGKSYVSGLSLTQSSRLETDADANKFACDTCGKSFTTGGSLAVNTSCRVKTYKCNLCTALRASQCERNVPEKILTRMKHFSCSTCGKSFAQSGHLREHERIHSGVKPFTCTLCGKSFAQAGNVRKHERIHSGVKPFTCTLCGKSFAHTGNLRKHEITHSGVKAFTCTLCGKSFSQKGNLRVHERFTCCTLSKDLHTGGKPNTQCITFSYTH